LQLVENCPSRRGGECFEDITHWGQYRQVTTCLSSERVVIPSPSRLLTAGFARNPYCPESVVCEATQEYRVASPRSSGMSRECPSR
jgi:hypothetical protein